MSDAQPSSFGEDQEWNLWVLENGLPEPPAALRQGEVVPIARWVGPQFGAVLSVWMWTPDEGNDDDQPFPDTEVELYRRVSDGWEEASGSSGGSWFDPPFERPDIAADEVWFYGEAGVREADWYVCGIYGLAGVNAALVELEDDTGVSARPIECPFGAFVTAVDGGRPAVVRVLDKGRRVLGETTFEGFKWVEDPLGTFGRSMGHRGTALGPGPRRMAPRRPRG